MSKQRARAFLVAVGINHHQDARLKLSYAENDARLLGSQLRPKLEGQYDVRAATLLSTSAAGQKPATAPATGENMRLALRLLAGAGGSGKPPEGLGSLSKAGPDDLVIVYFAGHGLVDASGEYRLLPMDTGALFDWKSPLSLSKTVSGSELAELLFPIDAGRLVLIVDSCYSSSGFVGDGFRPAPFAGGGLGRMAYDKRMLVLTASKPDAVAMEVNSLKQGLLTHALLREGVDRGQAEREGLVTLSSALTFARARAPGLHAEELHRRTTQGTPPPQPPQSGARVGIILDNPSDTAVLQQPVLFDYSRPSDEVVLRDRRPSKLHVIFDKRDASLTTDEEWMEEVEAALKDGEPVNLRGAMGRTVLHRLQSDPRDLDQRYFTNRVFRSLLAAKADPNIRDERGMTSLHAYASSWGFMRDLLEAGGDPKATTEDGLTVLQASLFASSDVSLLGPPIGLDPKILRNEISILQALRDKRLLRVDAHNFDGSTLLLRTMDLQDDERRLRLLQWLFDNGAKPEVAHMRTGSVALDRADTVAEASMLLGRYESKDAQRLAASRRLVSAGNLPMAEFLIGRGADINHRGSGGETPLMAHTNSLDMVTLLVGKGAAVQLRDQQGRNALDWALGKGSWSWNRDSDTVRIVKAILAAGTSPANEYIDVDGDPAWTLDSLTSAFNAKETYALFLQMKSMNLHLSRSNGSMSSALANLTKKTGSAEAGELDAAVATVHAFLEMGSQATKPADCSLALAKLVRTVLNERVKDYDERIGPAGTARLQELIKLLRRHGANGGVKLDDGKDNSPSVSEALGANQSRPLLLALRAALAGQ